MNPNFTLERFCYAPSCTLGVLRIRDKKFYTMEKPPLGNRVNESCIPQGLFVCKRYHSGKHGETFEVSVPGRTYILFHIGNTSDDVKGCIALGLSADHDRFRIARSKDAMKEFREVLSGFEEFNLYITQYHPKVF